MRAERFAAVVCFFLLLALGILFAFPLVLALLNSFKTQGEMFASILALPTRLSVVNYEQAFRQIHLLKGIGNSLVVTLTGVIGIIVCASAAGYKLSRTPGRISSFLLLLFVSSMLVPFHSIMISLTRIAMQLHLQNSVVGLGLINIGLGVNMAVFLYHGFVKGIPRELEESAYMDGCGPWRTFRSIVFPLLLPITVTIAILDILWIWNDFLLPLLILSDVKSYTLILSINMLFGQFNKDWSTALAALVLAVIPVMLLFVFFQRFIMQGIAEGAVKG